MKDDKGNTYEFNFYAPVGQNIAHVDKLEAHFDKDMQMQLVEVDDVEVKTSTQEQTEQQPQVVIGEPLNLFAPKKNLQELLRESWFAEVRSDERYDGAWTDAFIEALMASEYGEGIAREWAVKGTRNKRNQLKGYVVGLLKDAGVLLGSYDDIAKAMGVWDEKRTFPRYMSKGKRQPCNEWVEEWISDKKSDKNRNDT